MNNNEMAVIPTAELLTEMEALEVVGGIGDITGNYILAKCPENSYCSGANCVAGCGCPPAPEVPKDPPINKN